MTPPPPLGCPVAHSRRPAQKNQDWWPEQLDLTVLRRNESTMQQQQQQQTAYAQQFAQLDLTALEKDLRQLITNGSNANKDLWPADYGHYGPFFIRYVEYYEYTVYGIHLESMYCMKSWYL